MTDNHQHGQRSEKKINKFLGASDVAGSGAIEGYKSDGILEGKDYQFRLEHKATVNKSMSVKQAWWDKISEEAMETNKIPALSISFTNGTGDAKPKDRLVAIPAWLFEEVFGGSE
jgi:hypothetical protein